MWRAEPIAAFSDNYLWLLTGDNDSAAIVDPGDADPVLRALETRSLTLAAVLITHHHADHIGGIARLLTRFPHTPVYGPADTRIAAVTHRVKEGDSVELDFLPARFRVIEVPGHTLTHIAYYSAGGHRLFCGDTIFACGCGRIFEGSAGQMYDSLLKLRALPAQTEVYCAHEYTLANIAFAKCVEPDNTALLARERDAKTLRRANRPTVPSTLALECETNPFLRFDCQAVIDTAAKHSGRTPDDGAQVFSRIRAWKDTWSG